MNNTPGQLGYAKLAVVLALCLLVVSFYYLFSYRPAHSAKVVAHRAAVAKQIAKVNKANQLETKLQGAWQQAVTADPPDGNIDIAVYDNTTGATAHFTNVSSGSSNSFITASIVKLSILETLLWHNQQNGLSGLTSSQLSDATPMIENSDNDAAQELYDLVGDSSALNVFFKQIGTTDSAAAGPWGLTHTTALDQLKVIGEVAYPGKLLNTASANQANDLMNHIESDQQWGVSGGVPADVSVQLKNGWLPNSDIDGSSGWNVNSVGHVHGEGEDYTIAVLTNGDSTEQRGIDTIEVLSTTTWKTLQASS